MWQSRLTLLNFEDRTDILCTQQWAKVLQKYNMPALYWPSKKLLFSPSICTSKFFKSKFTFNCFPHSDSLETSLLQIRFLVATNLLHPPESLKPVGLHNMAEVSKDVFFPFFLFSFHLFTVSWENQRENRVAQSLKSDFLPRTVNKKDSFVSAVTNQEAIVLWTYTENEFYPRESLAK